MNGIAPLSRIGGMILTLVAALATAQDNAVTSAVDAFGERVGIEQSGLYTESEVRGFNLNNSGAYRIDGAYFSRAGALDDTVLSGVSVRVGVNAARLAYPAPSGVVNYRLREAGPANELRLGAGFRDYGTRRHRAMTSGASLAAHAGEHYGTSSNMERPPHPWAAPNPRRQRKR